MGLCLDINTVCACVTAGLPLSWGLDITLCTIQCTTGITVIILLTWTSCMIHCSPLRRMRNEDCRDRSRQRVCTSVQAQQQCVRTVPKQLRDVCFFSIVSEGEAESCWQSFTNVYPFTLTSDADVTYVCIGACSRAKSAQIASGL